MAARRNGIFRIAPRYLCISNAASCTTRKIYKRAPATKRCSTRLRVGMARRSAAGAALTARRGNIARNQHRIKLRTNPAAPGAAAQTHLRRRSIRRQKLAGVREGLRQRRRRQGGVSAARAKEETCARAWARRWRGGEWLGMKASARAGMPRHHLAREDGAGVGGGAIMWHPAWYEAGSPPCSECVTLTCQACSGAARVLKKSDNMKKREK